MTTNDNPMLDEVRKTACQALSESFIAQEREILKHLEKGSGKAVSLSFPIKVNMDAREIEANLNFTEKHSCPLTFRFDDPNQTTMDLQGGAV